MDKKTAEKLLIEEFKRSKEIMNKIQLLVKAGKFDEVEKIYNEERTKDDEKKEIISSAYSLLGPDRYEEIRKNIFGEP